MTIELSAELGNYLTLGGHWFICIPCCESWNVVATIQSAKSNPNPKQEWNKISFACNKIQVLLTTVNVNPSIEDVYSGSHWQSKVVWRLQPIRIRAANVSAARAFSVWPAKRRVLQEAVCHLALYIDIRVFKKLRSLLHRKRRIQLELCVRLSVLRLFHVGDKIDDVHSRFLDTNGFHGANWGREWKIYCCGLVLSSEPQIWKFDVVILQTSSKNYTKRRADCAARLFFLLQIK